MMSLVRWNPFTPASRGWFPRGWFWEDFLDFPWFSGPRWWPRMDVYAEKDDMVVKMELPDMNPEDVDISIEDGCLVISGRQLREDEEEGKNYYRRERFAGSFTRHIPLPEDVDESDVKARLKKGVLEVRVKGAGREIKGRKRIPIETS